MNVMSLRASKAKGVYDVHRFGRGLQLPYTTLRSYGVTEVSPLRGWLAHDGTGQPLGERRFRYPYTRAFARCVGYCV